MRLSVIEESAIESVSLKGLSWIMCFEASSRGGLGWSSRYCGEFHGFRQTSKGVETIRCNVSPYIQRGCYGRRPYQRNKLSDVF
jgi:hypothetical protein